MIRLIFLFFMIAFFALFATANPQEVVPTFYGGLHFQAIPLGHLVIGAALLGAGAMAGLLFPGWMGALLKQRKQTQRIEHLEKEIDRLQSHPRQDTSETDPLEEI